MSTRASFGVALASAALATLALSVVACGTPPEPPSTATLAMPSAHPSPDPPPARPLSIERDAASDADAGSAFDAGLDADGGAALGADAGAALDAGARSGELGPPIVGADDVVARLRGRFRDCYKLGLKTDPKMNGRVVLKASVSGSGTVVAVSPGQVEGMSPRVVACLVTVMKKATFTAPGGSGSSLVVPVLFRQ